MTDLAKTTFTETALDALAEAEGTLAVLIGADGKLGRTAARANRLSRGAVARAVESEAFGKLKQGQTRVLGFPGGMAAERLVLVKLDRTADAETARRAGAAIAKAASTGAPLRIEADSLRRAADLVGGALLRNYAFTAHKSANGAQMVPEITVAATKPADVEAAAAAPIAVAGGVFLTRDLTNEPANVLTTTEFATRLEALSDLGVSVEVLEEPALADLGMNALLGVGRGSVSPSKVVVMRWEGGAQDAAPLALVGKGVVFDTGGISLKPAGGMEDMTMDMGGAAVVAGVMHAVAARKAPANVVGLVGLVENMPDGNAQRPGDVVTSMKGDTIEVINTDAEGRLVLADVLWYAQDRFAPAAMIDLATLTGAVIIGLGHHNAGVFANDDALAEAFLAAAGAEEEGAWRLPLGPAYDKQLSSRIADMSNVGGRPAGAITAAQFLQRFVKDDMPWIHLDIAGVASRKDGTDFAPRGATGWGVRALDRLIAERFQG
ncbi:MAG: leucyl aminopeptidase [Pseudomonadota bacterium]